MKIYDFYTFDSSLLASTLQVHPIKIIDSENDVNNLIKGEFSEIDFPVVFKQEYGKKETDILDTGYAFLYLISDRMKAALEQEGFTGWTTFPVQVLDKKGKEIPGYHGLSIIGRCGPIDFNRCEPIQKQRIPNGPINTYYKGLYVGLDQWDGSDFFVPKGSYSIIINSAVATFFRKNKFTNVSLENLLDIEMPGLTVEKLRTKAS